MDHAKSTFILKPIVGTAPYVKPGVAFAFSVVWRNGTSTTVWTAQCIVCDGREKLLTSRLQRYIFGTRKHIWESTRIGQDTFTRFEQPKSPKMHESKSILPPFVRRTIKIWDPDVQSKPCSLKADTHEGFFSRSMLQGHAPGAKLLRVYQRFLGYTSLILYLREQNFHPAKCSTIFNRLNI